MTITRIVSPREILKRLRYVDGQNPTKEELDFRNTFLEFFPDQGENVRMFQENSGCKCVSKIVEVMYKDMEVTSKVVKKLFGEEFSISGTSGSLSPLSPLGFDLIGEVRVIEDTEVAYRELVRSAGRFRGLTIMPAGGNKLRVFFY